MGHPPGYSVLVGVGEFEPSAAWAHDGQLFVMGDDEGMGRTSATILGYDYGIWDQPKRSVELDPDPRAKYFKVEGATPHGDGPPLWWDTVRQGGFEFDPSAGLNQTLKASVGGGFKSPIEALARKGSTANGAMDYVTTEGVAYVGDELLLATRSYTLKDPKSVWSWPRLVNEKVEVRWQPKDSVIFGNREFSFSDLAWDGEKLWILWSWEEDFDGTTRTAAAGRLGYATFDGHEVDEVWIAKEEMMGKPEGLAIDGDRMFVVFDIDKDAKSTDASAIDKFPLQSCEAYVRELSKREVLATTSFRRIEGK